jgi:hypothetical protein
MSQPSIISARLLAHARLCREIANATLNEETASKLERMSQDCIRAAREAELAGHGQMFPSPAGSRLATS